jgi:HEAT repeat protein
MDHVAFTTYAPLAAASLVLLGLSLGCIALLARRRDRAERHAQLRRAALVDALSRGDLAAVAAHCRQARLYEAWCDDVRLVAARGLSAPERMLLARAAGESNLVQVLRRRLAGDSPAERGHAAQLIAVLAQGGAARELEPLLDDPDPDVRFATARAIGELESRDGARVLIRALGRSRIHPDRLLEQLARPSAVRELVLALAHADGETDRSLLAEALGLTRSVLGIPPLAALVREGDEEERLRACRALGRIGRPEVVALLVEGLADETWTVRAQAARALTGIADSASIPELEAALRDGAWWVRANAADALRLAGPAGIAALERATRSSSRFAAERAREALALLTPDDGDNGPLWLELAA